jgi:hypothetical protein
MILLRILEWNDLLVTPGILAIVYSLYKMGCKKHIKTNNPYIKSLIPKVFFLKFFAMIAFAVIHEILYGGDTINYTKRGGGIIYNHFFEDPINALKIIFMPDFTDFRQMEVISKFTFDYHQREALVIKICAVCSLFTFDTYTSISLILSTFALSGLWAMYLIFVKHYPQLFKEFAIAFFFIPSVVFWSSGVLKEPLAIGGMGWLFWSLHSFFFGKERKPIQFIMLIISFLIIKEVKVYILLCFMPALIFWLFIQKTKDIKNLIVRRVFTPILFGIGIVGAFYAATMVTLGDQQYDLTKIAETTKTTSEWVMYVSKRENGSTYDLGAQDGTMAGMAKIALPAINVALFRPYIWEARNLTMFISSLESLWFLFLTLQILIKVGFFRTFSIIGETPMVLFCFIFAITFAFAVGISSYNFGTLVRYKIPFMPFYLSGLFIMQGFIEKKTKKKPIKLRNDLPAVDRWNEV